MVMNAAGRDNRYGSVAVEFNPGPPFDDPEEPVFLLRARDALAIHTILAYIRFAASSSQVPTDRIEGMNESVEAFKQWQNANAQKVQYPMEDD